MRPNLRWIALLLIVLLPGCGRKEILTAGENRWLDEHHRTFVLAPDPSYAPFEFIDEEGEFQGIAADYARLVERKLGITLQVVRVPSWAENVEKAKRREIDVWSAVVETPERRGFMRFTTPYAETQPVFVVSSSRAGGFSLDGPASARVAVVDGYYTHYHLRQRYPVEKIVPVRDALEGLRAVADGEVDAMLTDVATASYLIRTRGLRSLRVAGNADIPRTRLAFATRSDWPILHQVLQKALHDISESERQAIHRRWLQLEEREGVDPRSFALLALAVLVLVTAPLALFLARKWLAARPGSAEAAGRPLSPRTVLIVLLAALAAGSALLAGSQAIIKMRSADFLTAEERQWLLDHRNSLRVAPDFSFAPFEFVEDGVFKGISADYVRLLEKQLDCSFQVLLVEKWSDNVRMAKAREFDVWSAVAPTEAKREYMLFTSPYLKIMSVFVVPADRSEDFSLESATGESIAVVDGYFTHDYLLKHHPEARIKPVRDAASGLRAVALGGADVMFIDIATASYLIRKEALTGLRVAGSVDTDYSLAFASRSDWPVLNSVLEKGLARITPSEREEVYRRWVPYGASGFLGNGRLVRTLGTMALLVLVLLGGVVAWNRSLTRVVTQKRRELEETERSYREIFNATNEAIIIHDAGTGAILDVNRTMLSMYGWTYEEALGLGVGDISSGEPPCSEEEAARRVRRAVEEGPQLFEWRARRKDGDLFWVEVALRSTRIGGQGRVLAVVRDITDRKRADEERLKLEVELRQAQKMEAIGTLAGGIAHDFNNVLAAILGYAELAREAIRSGDPRLEDIEQVISGACRARDLVKQILTFSRKGELSPEPMDPSIIVKECLRMLRASLPSTIEIRQRIDEGCGAVHADPTRLQQVVMNLCTNAVQSMKDEKGVLTVTLTCRDPDAGETRPQPGIAPGPFVELAVADTGHGMDDTVLERIFEPYFTTKEKGRGTGMGLATVHGIVKEFGGVVRVESAPGRGSTFRVYLPSAGVSDGVIGEEAPHELPRGDEHILAVDDEPAIAALHKSLLERLGYRVTTAGSSAGALEAFRADPGAWDLLLTDQTMPAMPGTDLAREILGERPGLPVILYTGYSSMVNDDVAREIGISAVAMKPLDGARLAVLVREVLDGKRSRP